MQEFFLISCIRFEHQNGFTPEYILLRCFSNLLNFQGDPRWFRWYSDWSGGKVIFYKAHIWPTNPHMFCLVLQLHMIYLQLSVFWKSSEFFNQLPVFALLSPSLPSSKHSWYRLSRVCYTFWGWYLFFLPFRDWPSNLSHYIWKSSQ